MKYAKWTGTGWEIINLGPTSPVIFNTSLALDAAGRPHITYANISRSHLKYLSP
ncbi:hypothetical protein [Hyalangium versicolor]|uniref:hypothetical protein n=1 Tax=Hyalangium versicolor TaxID=2861190 RepID=UPI001CCCA0E7|nr:hypothetical protein [Hyalangium versicolor]